FNASRATSFHMVGLKERAQIERCSGFSVRHRRDGTIMDTVDRPTDDGWSSFAARTFVPLLSARADLAGPASAALSAEELPTPAGADPRIVAAGDVGCAVVCNDIEPLVLFIRIICAADIRCSSIAAIATGARDTDPIRTARNLGGVLSRLIERALVAN